MGDRLRDLVCELGRGAWGLARARIVAREVECSARALGDLVTAIFNGDVEIRKRAADVARRITERSAEPLWSYADELAGLLAEISTDESRTR